MSAWMDFIGQSYYTIPKFIEESKIYGITRRIALIPLMAMNWDDRVLCVQQEPNIEAFSAFIEFPITKLVGLTPEAIEAVSGLVTIKKVADAPEEPEVERECGSYEQGAMYTLEGMALCDVAKLLKKLKDQGMDVGKLMIGCSPEDITYIPEPYPRIKRLKFFRGFRSMNMEKFWEAVSEEDCKIRDGEIKGENPVVEGTFYKKHIVEEVGEGVIQEVTNYQKSNNGIKTQEREAIQLEKDKKNKLELERLEALYAKRQQIVISYIEGVERIRTKASLYLERQIPILQNKLTRIEKEFQEKSQKTMAHLDTVMERYRVLDSESQEMLSKYIEKLNGAYSRALTTEKQLQVAKGKVVELS